MLKDYEKAKASFDASAADPALRENALFNKGNAEFMGNGYDAAAQNYKSALLMNPRDEDAKHNLELALRRKKNPQQEQKDKKNDKKDSKDKDKPKGSGGEQDNQNKKEPQSDNRSRNQNKNPGMSKEDADRIMQMAKEKEDAAMNNRQAQPQKARQSKAGNGPETEQDW
jgi:Ca-activated chloride channel family protein